MKKYTVAKRQLKEFYKNLPKEERKVRVAADLERVAHHHVLAIDNDTVPNRAKLRGTSRHDPLRHLFLWIHTPEGHTYWSDRNAGEDRFGNEIREVVYA